MKQLSIFLLALHLFGFQQPLHVNEQQSNKLNQLADEALRLTQFGEYEHAKQIVIQIGDYFSKQSVQNNHYTMKELHIISKSYDEARDALTSVDMSQEERVRRLTTLRLVLDAQKSVHQPLWLSMEKPLLSALDDMRTNKESLTNFYHMYTTIQPSLQMIFPEEVMTSFESKLHFLKRNNTNINDENYKNVLNKMEEDLQFFFSQPNKSDADPSVWWVIITTGSIIISTLTYVSLRKYYAEKKKQKKRDANR